MPIAVPQVISSRSLPVARRFLAYGGLSLIALGSLVMVGWALDIERLVSLLDDSTPMKFNTALAVALTGLGLWAADNKRDAAAAVIGGFVMTIGLLSLWEVVSGMPTGFGELIIEDTLSPRDQGRLSPQVSLALLLLGATLASWRDPIDRRRELLQVGASVTVSSLGFIGLIGYVTSVPHAYTWLGFTAISLPASLALFIAGGALLADAWVSRRVSADQIPSWAAPTIGVSLAMVTVALGIAVRGLDRGNGLAYLVVVVGLAVSWMSSRMMRYARDLHLSKEHERAARKASEELAGLLRSREGELVQISDELRRSNADLEQFAHVASHDLQEPLRSAGGLAALLQEQEVSRLTDRGRGLLEDLTAALQRMQVLTRDLLALAAASRPDHSKVEVSIAELTIATEEDLRRALDETGGKILSSELPVVVGDEVALLQVMENLVANALKFRESDVQPVIQISCRAAGGYWRIAVADNGIGIPAHLREQVFEPFRRLHTRDVYPGSGIGLALCRKIIEWHGGRIWAEGNYEGGSTFVFTLPRLSVS